MKASAADLRIGTTGSRWRMPATGAARSPEPLIFYRQHPQPANWPNRNDAAKRALFRDGLRRKYPRLWRDAFPKPVSPTPRPFDAVEEFALPQPARPLTTTDRLHVLMVFPWLNLGGADRFNLNVTGELVQRGHTVTIATTIASDDPLARSFRRAHERHLQPAQVPEPGGADRAS